MAPAPLEYFLNNEVVMKKVFDAVSWPVVLLLVLGLGLAPFWPEPHLWQKLKLLVAGDLVRPLDVFDLALHAAPWLFLAGKLIYSARNQA